MNIAGPLIKSHDCYLLPDRMHCGVAVRCEAGETQGYVHPFYKTLWLLLSAGFCLALCSSSLGDDIFKATGRYVEKTVSTTQAMTHAEMVAKHNQLHGGGSWTWPGDLATHLRETHGVNTVTSKTVSRVQSSCPGGVCPTNRPVRMVTRQRGFFRWRR